MNKKIRELLNQKKDYKRWLKVVAALAVVVVLATVNILTLPGSAWTGEQTATESVKTESEVKAEEKTTEAKAKEEATTTTEAKEKATEAKEKATEAKEKATEAKEKATEAKTEAKEKATEASTEAKAEYKEQTLEAKSDNYKVTVVCPSDAKIPEGATLKVTELKEDSDEFKDAKKLVVETKKLDEKKLGFDAVDISIFDGDKEIEPEGKVQVKIEAINLPGVEKDQLKDVIDSMEVQHITENDGKAKVETVADTTDKVDGQVKAKDEKAVAEFKVDVFSTYTITWTEGDYWSGYYTAQATIHYVDEDGNEITGPFTGKTLPKEKIELNQPIDNYTYQYAYINNYYIEPTLYYEKLV